MKHSRYLFLGGLVGISSLSAAPFFENTGSIYRNIKNNSESKIERKKHPKSKVKAEQQTRVHGQKMFVKGFNVVGNDELTKEELNTVLAPFSGKMLSRIEIQNAANALTEYFHKKGIFAEQTSVRPHSMKDGVVTLAIDERHLEKGGISVVNEGERIKSDKVLKLWNNTMKPGVMKQNDYERAMLLTNDFPGVSAKADLYFGEEENTDDLVVTITDEDVFNGNIDIDNFGSYYTGRTELGTTLYWNSPTGNGEEIVARFITTGKYSNYGYLDYAIPVGNYDTRLGASVDYLTYELKHQEVGQGGDGKAWNVNLYMKHPLIRTEKTTVEVEAKYTHTELVDNNLTAQLDDTRINKGTFTISGNRSDELLLNAITYFSASLTAGETKLNDKRYRDLDALTSNTEGTYAKFNFSLSRLQNLVADLSTKISVDGQWASKNLDTSEKYFLGGPYSMAGYPTGQISGDNAAVFYADLRYDFYKMPWGGDFQLKAFYSYGWAKLLKDPEAYVNYYSADLANNEMILQTVGLGLSQTWSSSVVVRAMVGKQIGDNEYRTIPVNKNLDYDMSDSDYRGWFELIYYF